MNINEQQRLEKQLLQFINIYATNFKISGFFARDVKIETQ